MYLKLEKQLNREAKNRRKKFIDTINGINSIDGAKKLWYINQYLTPAKKRQNYNNLKEFRAVLLAQYDKVNGKKLMQSIDNLKAIENSPTVARIEVEINWAKSRTWGCNPTPNIGVWYTDGTSDFYTLSSVRGCGFDKQSQAVANVLNLVNGLKKSLYEVKNKKPLTKNGLLFGYGSGYGLLPYFEGGVGAECYKPILNKIGYTFNHVANGKMYDKYTIEKKK